MSACPSCARESPADFAFCPGCGTKLAPEQSQANESPALTEERKVVTTLFCDLVSYTAHSEASDHELIDALLQRYNALAKRLVEGHGGVVEKFIGDAVLAVFGFPRAHDDDAERAVRCALKLATESGSLAWPDGDLVEVRIGVNTGETYLHTDVDPASGETFLTGDAVNTAARLETAAPPGGIVVGELTHSLTDKTITYEELEPLVLKGKAEPVPAWLTKGVSEASSRTGLRTTGKLDTPFLGRSSELRSLAAALDAAVATRRAQFRLLVGEPGIGKSRLVLEFAHALDARPELVRWRQGRCLPFGEGVAFWALGEIVKAHAGILDSDDVVTVEEKLEVALPEGEQRPWFRQRLRPLLGLDASQASREESFAAWTQFLTYLAESGPTVVVLEDLHWAGEGMLSFVEHLAAEALETPLLVVGTARPELLQRHPDLLAPTTRIARLVLSPLSRKDTALLVSSLLDERLAAEVRRTIIERVGGNPLYAEEYVRLLLDRGLLTRTKGALRLKEGEQLPLPDTVQAVLAARLDTLTPDLKALLCDAAVFGESFWAGGVAALAECSATEVEAAMAALAERQLVRAVASSTLAGESEYLFWHALARDVAYEQLPRRARARKHQSAALWIEQQAGDRAGDVSQVLAHHFVTALDLARATGEQRLSASLLDPAVRYLELAGNVIIELDATTTERYFTRALELVSNDAAQRPRLLASWGIAVNYQGRLDESAAAFEEAIVGLRASGELRKAAEALTYLGSAREMLGRPGAEECTAQALALLEGDEPSPESVFVLYNAAIEQGNLGQPGRAKELAERAVAGAAGLEPMWQARALSTRGVSRCALGDGGGLADMRTARDVAVAEGCASSIVVSNYAVAVFVAEGPAAALPISRDHLSACRTQGMRRKTLETRCSIFEMLCANGSWEEALADAAELARDLEEIEHVEGLISLRASLVILLARRGETDGAGPQIDWLLEAAQEMKAPAALAVSTIAAITVSVIVDQARARGLLETLVGSIEPSLARLLLYEWPEALRVAHAIGAAAIAERMTTWVEPLLPVPACARRYADALLAEHHGQLGTAVAAFADAASRWHDFGVPYEEGQALLGQGRCLAALGGAPQAAAPLASAREIFTHLGAKPALAETVALLARATTGCA